MRDTVPTTAKPPKKSGPLWTFAVLSITAAVTLLILMLASHH